MNASPAAESLERSLLRIAEREGEIGAWVELDEPGARAQARAIDESTIVSPLAGLTLGVKDIIDVAGLKCECGSPAFEGRRAYSDAPIIARLKALGMVVVGKTTTAELAYLRLPGTRNPVRLDRSPGGSSSGSAAAVGDRHVDAALGTQTAGSILRPAAFCGVVGFKPTFGRISRVGVLSCAPSLDTVGWITKDVATCQRMYTAYFEEAAPTRSSAKIGICRTVYWSMAESEMQEAIDRVGALVSAVEATSPSGELDEIHSVIMCFEMRQEFAQFVLQRRNLLSEGLGRYLTEPPISEQTYLAALARQRSFDIDALFGGAEVLIGPSAPGVATPWGSTGDPRFNRFATLLGLPAITIPIGRGANGLPLGVQLIARRGADAMLIGLAYTLEQRLGDIVFV